MTPTLARMIAARSRDIPLPARWYTIANVFRYERPRYAASARALANNADLVGAEGVEADAEIIAVAHGVMRSMGAEERDFEIRVSDRRILDSIYQSVGIAKEYAADVTRLLDRRAKVDDFEKETYGNDSPRGKSRGSLSKNWSASHRAPISKSYESRSSAWAYTI